MPSTPSSERRLRRGTDAQPTTEAEFAAEQDAIRGMRRLGHARETVPYYLIQSLRHSLLRGLMLAIGLSISVSSKLVHHTARKGRIVDCCPVLVLQLTFASYSLSTVLVGTG